MKHSGGWGKSPTTIVVSSVHRASQLDSSPVLKWFSPYLGLGGTRLVYSATHRGDMNNQTFGGEVIPISHTNLRRKELGMNDIAKGGNSPL